ncbi:MAG: arginine--tRNA ligase [Pseudomonadota bacterium]
MKTIQEALNPLLEEAFEACGFDPKVGIARAADRPDLADFQCNGALALGKALKRNSREVAAEVAERLEAVDAFESVSIAGPGFINLTLSGAFLSSALAALEADGLNGIWRTEEPEKIVIDYGGPNVAKPLHVGHLRAAIIGEALKRLFRLTGHTVVGDVHLGDWGLQMGQLISELALREPDLPYFSDTEGPFPDEPPVSLEQLEEMYPAASAACKADEARASLARKATKALQDGHPGYTALWRHFVNLSVAAMKQNYADLSVEFDLWKGEGDVHHLIPALTDDLKGRNILELSDGAWIIQVARDDDKKKLPPIIFINSEGAIGYHATDLATIVDRVNNEAPGRIFYVVDGRQKLHFEQVFRASDRAGYFEQDRLEHLWMGTMNGSDGKPFKTREGGVLKLRDLIDTVTDKALERLKENDFGGGADDNERLRLARMIGVAALKFADLSNPRTTDYIFDFDRFMSFEGKTGPYLLYAFVRVRSVLEKADALALLDKHVEASPSSERTADEEHAFQALMQSPECHSLSLKLLAFTDASLQAIRKRMPHIICEHAFQLTQAFSTFYAAHRIADESDPAKRDVKLRLVALTGRQLSTCFDIMAISAPRAM